MPYFLQQDLEALDQKIADVIEQLKATGMELRTAVTQSSETWHDNFGFENAQQQARLLTQRLDDLEHIRRNATIVEAPTDTLSISIGHTVTARDTDTNAIQNFTIGSHITFTENTISYASPLGALFLGKAVGQRIKGVIGPKERQFEIIEIR